MTAWRFRPVKLEIFCVNVNLVNVVSYKLESVTVGVSGDGMSAAGEIVLRPWRPSYKDL